MLIVSPETEALIRAKASEVGQTPDEYLHGLVVPPANGTVRERKIDIARLKAIADQVAALPILDPRSEKEITDEGWGM